MCYTQIVTKDYYSKKNYKQIYLGRWATGYLYYITVFHLSIFHIFLIENKGNNKITELRTILQRESKNS